MLAAERLGQGLVRWSRNRKGWAFLRIMNGVAITTAESDVRERTRRALREAGEQARRNQDAAVEVSSLATKPTYFIARDRLTCDCPRSREERSLDFVAFAFV